MRTIRLPLLLVLLLAVVFTALWLVARVLYDGEIPAPPINNNPMLNEKFGFMRELGTPDCAVVAVGSSMTANNLDSEEIVEAFPVGQYVNMAAYNLKMEDIRRLSLCLVAAATPEYIIVNSNLMDFYGEAQPLEMADYGEYLHAAWTALFYVEHWNPVYMQRFLTDYVPLRETRDVYLTLDYDAWGGAPLEIYGDEIDQSRFQQTPDFTAIDEAQYASLEQLADELTERGVTLVFAQSSYRAGIVASLDHYKLRQHVERLRRVVRAPHIFIDTTAETWPDSLYCDYSHLNARGAVVYTDYVMSAALDTLRARSEP